MIDKIKKLFEDMGCPPLVITRTPHAGDEVDNGCGVDFELAEWAVIYDAKGELSYYDNSSMKHDFCMAHNTDIMAFCSAGCSNGVQALVDELKERDGYEVQWAADGVLGK